MVYKPKKTVNGHKRNDRSTRRRKALAARRKRIANRPVRSNVKRYVAEQFGKTHPDNRFYQTLKQTLKPTHLLSDTPRYYPFGSTFQNVFLRMEFNRMKEVVAQSPAQAPLLFGQHGPVAATQIGNFNHWRSLLGRGIHVKKASVYGEIRLNEIIPLQMQNVLKYGNLKLHMFVLEDKAVTKTEFLNWYKDALEHKAGHNFTSEAVRNPNTVQHGPQDNGTFDQDLLQVPYVAGSHYISSSTIGVCGEAHDVAERPSGGFDEFLIDWRQFYDTDRADNPATSLFYNEVKCTTHWDGTRDHAVLPVNKSRFIVHEHKTWSFKPKANGCLDTVIPFDYTFPEHYMTYDKELLDMPFAWNMDTDHNPTTANKDDQGLHVSWLMSRKQPFMVFVYTCDNPYMIDAPSMVDQPLYKDGTGFQGASGSDPQQNTAVRTNVYPEIAAGDDSDDPASTRLRTDKDGDGILSDADEQMEGGLKYRKVTTETYPGPAIKDSHVTSVGVNEVFDIKIHFKCSYENKLATSIVPTINKGRPIIHKREFPLNRPRGIPREIRKRARTSPRISPRGVPHDITPHKPKGPVPQARTPHKPKGPARQAGPPRKRSILKEDIILPPTISPKSAHARDQYYLSKAQQTHNGLYVRGNFLYIYGTRTRADAGIRWPQIAAGNVGIGKFMLTERYKAAEKVLKANPHIKTVVGHSYGATTAYALTRNFRVKGRAYGSPVARVFNDARFQSFRHSGDPVSILDFAAKTSKRPFKGPLDAHSYKFHDGIYKSRSGFIDHDDL